MILTCAALFACASQKTKEQLAEDRASEAEQLLVEANEAMNDLEPELAEERLKEARGVLEDPAAAYWPDHSFQMQDLKTKEQRLVDVKAQVARTRLQEAVKEQIETVDALVQKLDLALKPLRGRDGAAYTQSRIEEATDVRSDVIERLNEGVALEKESVSYQAFAKDVVERMKAVPAVIEVANRAIAFNDGPVAASSRARELAQEAQDAEEAADKIAKLLEARSELDRCANGAKEVAKEPALAKVRFVDGGKGITPKSLARSCEKRSKALERQIAKLKRSAKRKKAPKRKSKRKKKG